MHTDAKTLCKPLGLLLEVDVVAALQFEADYVVISQLSHVGCQVRCVGLLDSVHASLLSIPKHSAFCRRNTDGTCIGFACSKGHLNTCRSDAVPGSGEPNQQVVLESMLYPDQVLTMNPQVTASDDAFEYRQCQSSLVSCHCVLHALHNRR